MGGDKYVYWFNVIVGPLLGGFVAYWVAASVLAEFSWCAACDEHCVRDWISALSGWAAAIGALIAAVATVPHLRHQALEAKRQADFVTGVGEPIVSLIDDDGVAGAKVVFIDNIKNIPIELIAVRINGSRDAGPFDIKGVRVNRKTNVAWARSIKKDRSIESPVFIDAWGDRSKPANRGTIVLIPREGVPALEDLEIEYRAAGELHWHRGKF